MGELAELWRLRGQLHAVLFEDAQEAVLEAGDVPKGEIARPFGESAFKVGDFLVKLLLGLRAEE
jgi:hypothetical protein